jgi:hypothetical protein
MKGRRQPQQEEAVGDTGMDGESFKEFSSIKPRTGLT